MAAAGFKVRLEDYERAKALKAAIDVLHKVGSPSWGTQGVLTGVITGVLAGVLAGVPTGVLAGVLTGVLTGYSRGYPRAKQLKAAIDAMHEMRG